VKLKLVAVATEQKIVAVAPLSKPNRTVVVSSAGPAPCYAQHLTTAR